MKILYICRIFSGFEESLNKGIWQPTGVPTIYKIIDYLDKSKHNLNLILTDFCVGKKKQTITGREKNFRLILKGLKSEIYVITDENKIPKILGSGIRRIWSEINRQISIIYKFLILKPDIIYVDRSNVVSAAILTRFFKAKTIIRIMGIYPSMWDFLEKNNLRNKLFRWFFKSNFELAICTNDGTCGVKWMKKAIRPGVKQKFLMNGVEKKKHRQVNIRKKNKFRVCFIGRLESIKGCFEFVRAISLLTNKIKRKICVFIIGTGSQEESLKSLSRRLALDEIITFKKRIPHKEMKDIHNICDIYVSLNKLGNLSNANLECFSNGICSIIPDFNEENLADLDGRKYFPDESLIRIPISDQESELAKAITDLVRNPKKIEKYSKNIFRISKKRLLSWDLRIKNEITLIESLIK